MYGNQFSVKTIKLILQVLKSNTKLRKLAIPDAAECTEEIKRELSSLVQAVNSNRQQSCGCQVKLQEILFW